MSLFSWDSVNRPNLGETEVLVENTAQSGNKLENSLKTQETLKAHLVR